MDWRNWLHQTITLAVFAMWVAAMLGCTSWYAQWATASVVSVVSMFVDIFVYSVLRQE
jgi:hypothetical protein